MKPSSNFSAYISQPSVHNDTIVFVTDDDIWKVGIEGGIAARLTANKGLAKQPKISPSGKWIAYLGQDAGTFDVYVMSINGGESRRATYFGVDKLVRWKNDDTLIVASSFEAFKPRVTSLYEIN